MLQNKVCVGLDLLKIIIISIVVVVVCKNPEIALANCLLITQRCCNCMIH